MLCVRMVLQQCLFESSVKEFTALLENAAQNIQRMFSGCLVGELFLACYGYF